MKLWTDAHARTLLPTLLIMLVFAFLLSRLMKKKSYRIRMIPIQIIAVLLVLLELGKQCYSLKQGYNLYHIPLHYCSLILFVLPVMAFYDGKHKAAVSAVSASVCSAISLLMLIYPDLIYGSGDIKDFFTEFISFHTVMFHNLVLLAFLLILALDLHSPGEKSEWKKPAVFTAGFCVVACIMAELLHTRYANFYDCENIQPLENLRLTVMGALGYIPTQILYSLIVAALTVAFTVGAYWLYRTLHRIVNSPRKVSCNP